MLVDGLVPILNAAGTTKLRLMRPYHTALPQNVRWITEVGGDELKAAGWQTLEVIVRKIFRVFVMAALIVALIGVWLRFAPITTEAVTAANVQPLSNAISPFELTFSIEKLQRRKD